MSSNEQRKADIRSELRDRRRRVSDAERRAASASICGQLRKRVEQRAAVALFAAVDNEIDVRALAYSAAKAGVRLFYPRVTGPGEMAFYAVDGPDDLIPGAFGIPEPRDLRPAAPGEIELVLVPGVAFDREGNRLGFGGGYYDRQLEVMRGVNHALEIIGVAYHWQLLDEPLPTEEWDVRMDVVVTDHI